MHNCPWCGLAVEELSAFNAHLTRTHNRDPDDVDDVLGPDADKAADLIADKLGVNSGDVILELDKDGRLRPPRRRIDGPYL